jgi:MFS family permease
MASPGAEPSERTPLLPDPVSEQEHSSENITRHPIDPSGGFATQGGDAYDEEDATGDNLNGDVENQTAENGAHAQYAGMPEVREKMAFIFPAIAIGVFLSAADGTIIISSYGKIGSELDALNKTSWIANAYFLTLTAFQPLYGKLSDIFGRKACLLFAYFVFGFGCLFCGIAQDINQLIASRAFAGLGGGGMTTIVSILLSDIVPLRERGSWQGYINIAYATGAAAGAPLGGEFHVKYRKYRSLTSLRSYCRLHQLEMGVSHPSSCLSALFRRSVVLLASPTTRWFLLERETGTH